jgi:hypothetical protein
MPLPQSVLPPQDLPKLQAEQEPPQSTSVSLAFLTLSVQLGAWQSPALQTPEVQSALVRHALLSAHRPQPLPQSTSLSSPFLMPSVHVIGVGVGSFPVLSVPHERNPSAMRVRRPFV